MKAKTIYLHYFVDGSNPEIFSLFSIIQEFKIVTLVENNQRLEN